MRLIKQSRLRLMLELCGKLLRFSPLQFFLTLGLMLFQSITAGAGLLLIIPLLQMTGISVSGEGHNLLVQQLEGLLRVFHLPMNLLSILVCYSLTLSFIALAAFAENMTSTRLQETYIHDLRITVHDQLLHAKWTFFIHKKMSDLMHGITAQVSATSQCNFYLLSLISKILLGTVYTVLAFVLSWQMTCIAVLCSGALLCIMLPLHRLSSMSGRNMLHRNQTIFQFIYEQLGALKTIKSSGFESIFIKKTAKISASIGHEMRYTTRVAAFSKLLYTVGSAISLSALVYIAIVPLKTQPASLLMLLIVFSRVLPMISGIQQNYQHLLRTLPAYEDLKVLMNDSVTHRETVDDSSTRAVHFQDNIRFHNVSFSYRPGIAAPIIEQVSFKIKKNTTTALIGPSGIGKTTIADLMIGLLEPTSGQIFIDNELLDHSNRHAFRKSLAYLTQNTFLFNASIRDNLELFCDKTSDEALWDVLKKTAAAEFVEKLDDGLDTLIGDRGVRLSGGECQRIALARALLTHPQILILDESTSSLDSQNIYSIQQSLAKLHGTMTIVIISHQMEMSHFADQIIPVDRFSSPLVVHQKGTLNANKPLPTTSSIRRHVDNLEKMVHDPTPTM